MKKWLFRISLASLGGLYLLATAAPLLAPYSHKEQFREFFYAPPARIHFSDSDGNWSLRPWVDVLEQTDFRPTYRVSGRRVPLLFWVRGHSYTWMGLSLDRHLVGVPADAPPLFLMGSDGLGRDLFSRILYGAQFSLTIGLVGIVFTLGLGVLVGSLAGYFAGYFDPLAMRLADLFLSLPGLFLILGIRSVFPREMRLDDLYWLIVVIFTLIGWASVARVIRGQVLSLKSMDYVLAARAAGASHWRILSRHILPFTTNYLVVQSTILIPAFILGEITLSFLGVGVQEPDASWGNLLNEATSVRTLTSHPWLLAPAGFIIVAVLAFNLIGDELKALEKRRLLG